MPRKTVTKSLDRFLEPSLTKENMDLYMVRSSIIGALKRFLPQCKGVLLDVGCGEMPYRSLILPRVKEYIGLDIENALYQTNVKPDLFWDGRLIPLDDDSVDCAIATELFEHLPDIEAVLKEIRRVLKHGGSLFFTIPFLWPLHDMPNDEYRYTPFSLQRHLSNAGFDDIQIRALGGWDASLAQMIGLWLNRRPMSVEGCNEFKELLFPFYKQLIESAIKEDPPAYEGMLKESMMITGLSGTAVKPSAVSTRSEKPATGRKERVIVITDQFPVLSQTFILDQITGLIDRNIDIESWTLEIIREGVVHPKVKEYALLQKTRLVQLPGDHLRPSCEAWVKEFRSLNGLDDLADIAAFHVHFGPNFHKFEPLFRVCDTFVMVSFHGYDGSATIQIQGRNVYQSLFQRADLITTPSHYMKAMLIKSGCPAEKLRVHRYGVDVTKFSVATKDNDGKNVGLLTVARFVEKKGLGYALQAFARLPARLNATYRLIGDGPLLVPLQLLAKRLGIRDRVVFLGAQSHDVVKQEMAAADIFVLTSVTANNGDQEGVPVCLIEAQAIGLPVVSTQHAGIPELIMHEQSGFLAEEKNVAQISSYMLTLIEDRGLRAAFGGNARRRVLDEFNIDCQNDILAELLRSHQTGESLPSEQRQEMSGVVCPICQNRFPYFKPFGASPRANALCPSCHSLERHRLLWLYLQRKTDFFRANLKVLDVAPTEGLSRQFRKLQNIDYLSIDLDSSLAMKHMDLTDLALPDESFDCIFCYHVLEHIPDDHKAISELFRVLKPSGWAIIQVPIDEQLDKSIENPAIVDPQERRKLFGQADHVRFYGRDFKERLERAGYHVTADDFVKTLSPDEIKTFGLQENETIYFCRKEPIPCSKAGSNFARKRLKVVFAVTETGELSTAGDYFTAMEFGLAMRQRFGWDIELLPTPKWYNVGNADILIAMTHVYDPARLGSSGANVIKICWMRNWFDGWARQPSFNLWDVYLCSSGKAVKHMREQYGITSHLLRIATNPKRFEPLGWERTIDYCFTGNYWNDPRDIEKISPEAIGLSFALFGKNWEQHSQFKKYYRGFVSYTELPKVYNQAKILVDDANRVTKQWGSVNSRVFDALASGTLVITNSEESSRDAFHCHLPVYRSSSQLGDMLHQFINDTEDFENTLNTLRKMVLEYHTYDIRSRQFAEILSIYGNRKPQLAKTDKVTIVLEQVKSARAQNDANALGEHVPLEIRPRTSIIIPVFNKLDYTRKCLEAIAKNTPADAYEIVVVDNASTDGTNEFLSESSLPVRLIVNDRNVGFARACNQGARAASGEYLVFLNNDTEPLRSWLGPLIETADSDDLVVAVGSKLLYPDGSIQHAGIVVVDDREKKDPLLAQNNHVNKPSDAAEANIMTTYQALTAACLLVRRTAFEAVGGFDEGYWNGYEDVDLCFSLRAMGGKLVYQPASVVVHHESKSGPERYVKVRDNIARLHQKWLGRVKPDIILNRDGTVTRTEVGIIHPHCAPRGTGQPITAIEVPVKSNFVSIVILTFNQLQYTKQCVKSIQQHTLEPHEIIFVDNGSRDGTVKWLRKLTQGNPNYKLIENNSNMGFSKGCNQGIRASSGEYLLLLNNDVVVTENWLTGMLECLNSAPDTGFVGPMTNSISGPQRVMDDTYRSIQDLDRYAKTFRETYRHRRIPLRRIVGFCMLFRRELVKEIGLLDETFGSGNFEDDDFCLRAALEGYRNLIAGDVFIHHHGSRSFIGNKIDFSSAMAGNRKIFNEKWSGIDARTPLGRRLLVLKALEKADGLIERDQLSEAIDTYLQAIGHAPDENRAYHVLAQRLIEVKRFTEAVEALNEMPPDDGDLRRIELMGYCKEGLEQYREADDFADRALALNPKSALALNLKGIVAYKQGNTAGAEAFFKQAMESDPGYGEPYTNLGVLHWAAGCPEEGFPLLERGFILSPTVMDIVALYHSAVTAQAAFERAENLFQDACALHPAHKKLKFLLIDILIQQNKYEAAMQLIEEAMVVFGTDDGMISAGLEIRNKLGVKRIDKASKRATLSLCMIVKNEQEHLARCLANIKPIADEMIVVDTGSTDRTVDIARVFGAQVYHFEWTNHFADARNYSLSRAAGNWILVMDADEVLSSSDRRAVLAIVEKKRRQPIAWSFTTRNYVVNVAITGWKANDGTYAMEEAGTGWHPSTKVRLIPNDRRIQFEGHVHELLEPSLKSLGIPVKHCSIPIHHYGYLNSEKRIAKGQDYYRLGKVKLEIDTGDIQSLVELARQAGGLGEFEEAIELWQKVIELDPSHAEAFLNLGYACMELGRYEEALAAEQKSMALDPASKEAALNYSLCQLVIGEPGKAIVALEKLLREVPEYPAAMACLAVACAIDNEKDKALIYLDKIRKQGLDCTEALSGHARRFMSVSRNDQALLLLELALESNNVNRDVLQLLAECHRIRESAEQSHDK